MNAYEYLKNKKIIMKNLLSRLFQLVTYMFNDK